MKRHYKPGLKAHYMSSFLLFFTEVGRECVTAEQGFMCVCVCASVSFQELRYKYQTSWKNDRDL